MLKNYEIDPWSNIYNEDQKLHNLSYVPEGQVCDLLNKKLYQAGKANTLAYLASLPETKKGF